MSFAGPTQILHGNGLDKEGWFDCASNSTFEKRQTECKL